MNLCWSLRFISLRHSQRLTRDGGAVSGPGDTILPMLCLIDLGTVSTALAFVLEDFIHPVQISYQLIVRHSSIIIFLGLLGRISHRLQRALGFVSSICHRVIIHSWVYERPVGYTGLAMRAGSDQAPSGFSRGAEIEAEGGFFWAEVAS